MILCHFFQTDSVFKHSDFDNINELSQSEKKYSYIISKFLYAVYQNSHQKCDSILQFLSHSFKKRLLSLELTEELLVKSIKRLYDASQFEDALILQFMYLYRLAPSQIYLLDFDSFTNDRCLTAIKEESSNYKTTKVSISLLNDVNYYIVYRKLTGNEIKYWRRITHNGVILNGKFIFTQKPKTIYNRFNSGFGGSIPWFNYSPKDIITLSLRNYQNGEAKFLNL